MATHPSKPAETQFSSSGVTCRALLYLPETEAMATSGGGAPCVVMAHGFGATRDAGLEPYARRFAEAGLYALVFDYRHFGASDGEPRQLLSIHRQLADWQAAIDFVRSLDGVDPARIALWGSSLSGGHVVEAAVADGKVAAVVSQCPMMDGLAATTNLLQYAGLGYMLQLGANGLVDAASFLLGRRPRMLPIVAPPGHLAAMSTPDAEPGYYSIAPAQWRNEVCARIALSLGFYRPGLKAGKLPCPILIQVCTRDSVAPVQATEAAAQRAGSRAEVRRYEAGHFDIYTGKDFERSVADQQAFLTRILASNRGEQ